MDTSEMEQLVDLVKRSNIRELTLRQGESRITLKQNLFAVDIAHNGELIPYVVDVNSDTETAYAYQEDSVDLEVTELTVAVSAPLVGVFHHTRPIVGPGAHVKAGQVVAVIEAMKLFTEVTSPCDGVVVETLIEDGLAAEYGQPLMLVKAE